MFLGIEPGGWLVGGIGVVVALLAIFQARAGKSTPEATSLSSAWQHIAQLERELTVTRTAQRITEEGFDAMWSWGRRVREDWGEPEPVPGFTPDEEDAIKRARKSVTIARTSEIPVVVAGRKGES